MSPKTKTGTSATAGTEVEKSWRPEAGEAGEAGEGGGPSHALTHFWRIVDRNAIHMPSNDGKFEQGSVACIPCSELGC